MNAIRGGDKIATRENKETERDTEGVGWDMSILQKLFIYWLFNGSVSRNIRINTISLVFRSRFHRQNVTPLGPPLQAKFWMVLQTTDGGCLYADVLKTDFRSKWPSKNNFTELGISQSLDWQCPSLSPYFLLIVTYIQQSSLPFISEDYWLGSVSTAVIRLC